MKLFNKINKNTEIKIIVLPSNEVGPKSTLNSLWSFLTIILNIIDRLEGISQNIGEIININTIDLIQFLKKIIEDAGSNTENRFVIIFI